MQPVCIVCEAPDARKCSQCKSVAYCGKVCQKQHWVAHKIPCIIASVENRYDHQSIRPGLLVVHISGFSGSGKTTLGERIQRIDPDAVVVVDTDSFITHDSDGGRELATLGSSVNDASYAFRWAEIFLGAISETIERVSMTMPIVRVLVFVGLLDHYGPPDGSVLRIPQAHMRYWIEVDTARLMYQYYTRITRDHPSPDDVYWTHVANTEYNISASKHMIVTGVSTKKWHTENGYISETADQLYTILNRAIIIPLPQTTTLIKQTAPSPDLCSDKPLLVHYYEVSQGIVAFQRQLSILSAGAYEFGSTFRSQYMEYEFSSTFPSQYMESPRTGHVPHELEHKIDQMLLDYAPFTIEGTHGGCTVTTEPGITFNGKGKDTAPKAIRTELIQMLRKFAQSFII